MISLRREFVKTYTASGERWQISTWKHLLLWCNHENNAVNKFSHGFHIFFEACSAKKNFFSQIGCRGSRKKNLSGTCRKKNVKSIENSMISCDFP